ncbi:MAG: DUF1788 domain-containing protein [Thermomicrobiales bacterium]
MSAIEELVGAYRRHVKRSWDASLAGGQKVWFVVYDPAQERRLRFRISEFKAATDAAGRNWVQVDLTDAFANWMAQQRHREAYFADPEYAVYALAKFREEGVAAPLRAALTAPEVDAGTVVAVTGVGSLFGLVRVSEVIGDVAPEIRGRLAVFFPGHYDEKSYYRLFDARDGWDYHAAPITAP